ncbi:MAG TPA: hypothetical protein VGA08_02255 [Candidatus Saccharimonadales bacterium]
MERPTASYETISAWDHPAWQQAWAKSAEIINAIEYKEIPELAEITDDDPIGSSRLYWQQVEVYGPDSPQAKQAKDYVKNDARTAGWEALIKRGHVSIVQAQMDRQRRGFCVNGVPIVDISIRGLASSSLNNEEFIRRSVELNVGILVNILGAQGELNETNAMVWITPYAHDMADDLAAELGYDAKERTYMVRWFEVNGDELTMKQLNMKASDTIRLSRAMSQLGVKEASEELSATGILATPVIVKRSDFSNGPADIAKLIDNGEQWLGQELAGQMDYLELERVSIERERRFEANIDQLAETIINIARRPDWRIDQGDRYMLAIREFIDQVAAVDPELARDAIGEKAADCYRRAYDALADGDISDAIELQRQGYESTKDIYLCGMVIARQADLEPPSSLLVCSEFKIGQHVVCPNCHKSQIIIRANLSKNRLYCANQNCGLAKIKRKAPKRLQPAAKKSVIYY